MSVNLYKRMHWASISRQLLTLKMGQIVGLETLVFNLNQMPGNYPKEDNLKKYVPSMCEYLAVY
jgi:hypothetical protein